MNTSGVRKQTFRQAAAALLLSALAFAGGCMTYPDGRPVGVDAADALVRAVGTSTSAVCHDNHGNAPSRDSYPDQQTDYRGQPYEPAALAGEYGAPCYECGGQSCGASLCDSGPACNDGCAPACHGPHCSCASCCRTLGFFRWPRAVFSSAANFCIRPIAYAPAYVPPPGRFHPVPTQPVFMPR